MASKEKRTKAKTRKRTAKPKPPAEELVEKTVVMKPPDEVETATEVTGEPTTYVAVDGKAVPLPFGSQAEESSVGVFVPADGTLIRGDGGPVVYVMQDGEKRPLRDANVFAACGFGWNDIQLLSPEEIDRIPVGPEVARQADLQGKGA